jgi:predicted transcriptional regulator
MIDKTQFTEETYRLWELMLKSNTTWNIDKMSRAMKLTKSNITYKLKPLMKAGMVVKLWRGTYIAVDPTKSIQQENN